MPLFAYPADTHNVSDDYQAHRNRTPPSSNPGTDYTTPYGSPIRAIAPGVVTFVSNSNSSAAGRYLTINHGDGWESQGLHFSNITARVGDHVDETTVIGMSGASGFGSDWGYGPHFHQVLRKNGVNVDFEKYVGRTTTAGGGSTPITEENELDTNQNNQLIAANKNAEEARRIGAVIIGASEPKTQAEIRYRQQQDGIIDNLNETRRMLAVLLGAQAPAAGETVPR